MDNAPRSQRLQGKLPQWHLINQFNHLKRSKTNKWAGPISRALTHFHDGDLLAQGRQVRVQAVEAVQQRRALVFQQLYRLWDAVFDHDVRTQPKIDLLGSLWDLGFGVQRIRQFVERWRSLFRYSRYNQRLDVIDIRTKFK